MIDNDVFVVDATVHGWSVLPENRVHPWVAGVVKLLYFWATEQLHPRGDPAYHLSFEQFERIADYQPRLLESLLFAESAVDVALYQGVPLYGLFKDGSSPISIAERIRERFPHRMFIYGDVSPWRPNALERVDELVEKHKVIGLKFYPLDYVDGQLNPVRLDDEKNLFPLIERARQRGIKVIAVHKAIPLPPATVDRFDVDDVGPAAKAFPDMTFEIVHGGFAFNREIARLLQRHGNVSVNLEGAPCYALNHPARFADMIAPLLASGAHDRIFFSTGAPVMHPRPFVDAFWQFEMPRGYPALTPEIKRGILGENFARQHGWDVALLKQKCRSDQYGAGDKSKAAAWQVIRATSH
jgi:predicted TIM-barrel fold metal-dependent hydrolase